MVIWTRGGLIRIVANRIELALAWFGGLDSLDAATLDLLSHGPSVCATQYSLVTRTRDMILTPLPSSTS